MAEEDRYPTILPLSRVDGAGDPGPVSSGIASRLGEQSAAQIAELLPSFLEIIPSPILIVDAQLRVVVVNAEARQLLSTEQQSSLGYSVRRFLSFERLEAARAILMTRRGKHSYRDTLLLGGVEREVEVSVDRIEAGHTEFLCMTLSDWTNVDRERAEWQGTKVGVQPQERLERAHHLEALGHLTGSLAHDFNNLLAVILGSIEAAERRVRREMDPSSDLTRAKTATERSIQSTSQILRYARNRGMQNEPLYPGAVLLELRGLIERAIGDEIELIVQTQETPRILVSAAQLETTILNLVINSRDSLSQQRGEIRVELEACSLDESDAVAVGLVVGDYVMIRVSDDGQGIPEELQQRVFEPFFTTKPEGHGTGLGLSTVRSLMRKLGGAIVLRSQLGVGTTVELLFPAFPQN
jgi:signal transduction histidine kinase